MNIYIHQYGSKYYCLDPINQNLDYNWNSHKCIHHLICDQDNHYVLLHRIDGPAIEHYTGDKYWYYYGKHHRDDGPSIETYDGIKLWYYHGQKINCKDNKEFQKIIKMKAFI